MISLLPGSTPSETTGAYAILAIIADPEAAKKRLDELVQQAKTNQDLVAAHQASSDKAAKDSADADAKLIEAKKILAENESRADTLNAKIKEFNDAQRALKDKIDTHETAKTAKEKELQEREAIVSQRETSVNRLEADTRITHQAALALKSDLEERLSKLKLLAS